MYMDNCICTICMYMYMYMYVCLDDTCTCIYMCVYTCTCTLHIYTVHDIVHIYAACYAGVCVCELACRDCAHLFSIDVHGDVYSIRC